MGPEQPGSSCPRKSGTEKGPAPQLLGNLEEGPRTRKGPSGLSSRLWAQLPLAWGAETAYRLPAGTPVTRNSHALPPRGGSEEQLAQG